MDKKIPGNVAIAGDLLELAVKTLNSYLRLVFDR